MISSSARSSLFRHSYHVREQHRVRGCLAADLPQRTVPPGDGGGAALHAAPPLREVGFPQSSLILSLTACLRASMPMRAAESISNRLAAPAAKRRAGSPVRLTKKKLYAYQRACGSWSKIPLRRTRSMRRNRARARARARAGLFFVHKYFQVQKIQLLTLNT